ncbi:unnamed protein product [Strongylus vulgaris]|uniref:Galactosylgalactosylxylosylprotein 3-beta-glucuronosyltransferase n=1 Tax=Strongylus vulgaris TaxID=40348 RepID=A0A3P7JBI5_STRVU|nr:unnamed protein product [Strongylus vulgaris]
MFSIETRTKRKRTINTKKRIGFLDYFLAFGKDLLYGKELQAWLPSRPFAVDMAGFAVNLNEVLKKDIEPFGYPNQGEDVEVLVWHTKTVPVKSDRSKYPHLPFIFE